MDFSNYFNETTNRQIQKRKINLMDLEENKKNVYHISENEVSNLAFDIEDNGLLQPLIVKPIENDKYVIVSGHRRYNAYLYLHENVDSNNYNEIDCIVLDSNEDENVTLHKLHTSNLNVRTVTKYEYLKAYQDYLEIFKNLKQNGASIQGRTRTNLAEIMNVSENLINDIQFVLNNAPIEEIEKCREDDQRNEKFNALLKKLRNNNKKETTTEINNKEKEDKYNRSYFNKRVNDLLDYADYHNNQELKALLYQIIDRAH